MIYPQTSSFYYYGCDQSLFYYPQVFIPITFENPIVNVTGNIPTFKTSFVETEYTLKDNIKNIKTSSRRSSSQNKKGHLNIKNIIPNIVRKLFSFLTSEKCRQIMVKIDPKISKIEISRVITFIQSIKNSLGTYVGKRSLKKLWFKDEKAGKSSKTYQIIRKVSRHYLQNQCINSIVLSKRIKSSLKIVHLKYRRKILNLLNAKTNQEL